MTHDFWVFFDEFFYFDLFLLGLEELLKINKDLLTILGVLELNIKRYLFIDLEIITMGLDDIVYDLFEFLFKVKFCLI